MIESHRSFANTWECDENDHINVQFYFRWFEEAAEVFAGLHPSGNMKPLRTEQRHVRFHKEIHAAQSLVVESGVVVSGQYSGWLAHRMLNAVTGELCATALDQVSGLPQGVPSAKTGDLAPLLPRGLPGNSLESLASNALLEKKAAMVTNYKTIRHHDLDRSGAFLPSRIVSMFTDGAPHIWEHGGITSDWLNRMGFGRVAVEMKVQPVTSPEIGKPLRLVSRICDVDSRTFRIDHQVEELGTLRIIARGAVRCLVMDLATRRAVALPDTLSVHC